MVTTEPKWTSPLYKPIIFRNRTNTNTSQTWSATELAELGLTHTEPRRARWDTNASVCRDSRDPIRVKDITNQP